MPIKVSGTWRRDARDFDLATGNTWAFGIAWDGAYFYVLDSLDGKVYVYDADGNYQSDRDFNLATANNTARGIAWDGAYLYVADNADYVDNVDFKVYVYDADGTHVG